MSSGTRSLREMVASEAQHSHHLAQPKATEGDRKPTPKLRPGAVGRVCVCVCVVTNDTRRGLPVGISSSTTGRRADLEQNMALLFIGRMKAKV